MRSIKIYLRTLLGISLGIGMAANGVLWSADPVTPGAPVAPAEKARHFLTGKVDVAGVATLDLPDGWQYVAGQEARFLVEKVWNNPPDPRVVGVIFPPESENEGEQGWNLIVSKEDIGYVSDKDAASNNYDTMLKDMQSGAKEENEARVKQGYPAVDILGWAEPPHYDSSTHKLYWARRLKFSDAPQPTLNYDVRILGRHGVLVLTAISSADQLPLVAEGSKQILAKTEFTAGNRYQDYSASTGDKVAAYGIAGLITGGVLLKTGLLKLLIKPLIIGGIVLAGVIGKLMKRKQPEA